MGGRVWAPLAIEDLQMNAPCHALTTPARVQHTPEQQAFDFADIYRPRARLRSHRHRICPGPDSPVPGELDIYTPFGDRYRLDVWLDAETHEILRYRLQRAHAA